MTELTVLRVAPGDEPPPTFDRVADLPAVSPVDRGSLAGGKAVVEDRPVDCLVTAYDLPDGTGVDLVRHLREHAPDAGCIICTDTDPTAVRAAAPEGFVAEFVDASAPDAGERLTALVRAAGEERCQTAYPLPETEPDRCDLVDRLDLEAPALQRAFDRVTELAALHVGVERATVNVLSARTQEAIAARNVDWTTIPREETICTYAILSEGVTVVEDTDTDPRFAAAEALDELEIRFYAGAPITTDDGLAVGTLCVYDDEPRTLSADAERALELLAAEAMAWIDAHTTGPGGRSAVAEDPEVSGP